MKVLRFATLCLVALLMSNAHAAYPERPIKILLGFAPGGGSDLLLRTIAPALTEALGQQIVIEYLPGAGGNLAMAQLARAAADGYTLLMGTPGLATNTSLYANLTFDPLRDFAPVAMIGSVQNVVIVKSDLPVSSVAELIQYAKANPGKLNYASPGTGTSLHLAAELFKVSAGVDIVHVPYKGGAQALADVMAGQVDMMFNVLPSALPQIKAGRVKAIAVTGSNRSDTLQNVPTMIEAGLSGYNAVTWNGIVAPAATPKEIITKLNDAVVKILRTAEMRQRFAAIGTDVLSGAPEEFAKLIRDETDKWRRIIKTIGISAQ